METKTLPSLEYLQLIHRNAFDNYEAAFNRGEVSHEVARLHDVYLKAKSNHEEACVLQAHDLLYHLSILEDKASRGLIPSRIEILQARATLNRAKGV